MSDKPILTTAGDDDSTLHLLSEAELAILNGDDDTDEELDDDLDDESLDDSVDGLDVKDDAGSDEDTAADDDDDLGEGQGDTDSADDSAGDGNTDAADDDDDAIGREPGDIMAPSTVEAENIAALETSLAEVESEIKELKQKLRSGEIDDDEYADELDTLKDKQFDIKMDIRDEKAKASQSQQSRDDTWKMAQDAFFELPENKVFLDNGLMFRALGDEINRRYQDGDFDGNFSRLLRAAAAQLRKDAAKLLGTDAPAAQPEGKTRKDELEARRKKNAEKGKPKTLRNRGSESHEDNEGEFAHLDNLRGAELELAVSRLTPEQERRWAQS